MKGYSRRLFLQGGVVAAAGVLGAVVPAEPAHTPDRSFVVLRQRWREVTAGAWVDAGVEPYRARLAQLGVEAGRFRDAMVLSDLGVWGDLPFPSFVGTPERLLGMARAFVLPGTGVTGDPGLGAAVGAGIDHYRRRVYAVGAEPVGNWWHWRIGAPKRLLDAAVLIGGYLSERQSGGLRDAVDYFVPEGWLGSYRGNSTGANRVDLCLVMLLRAMLRADPEKADLAVSALSPVFPLVEEGDGFYRDGSFIQHTFVPYQGAYGSTLLNGIATMFAVLRGSPWEITDERVFDAVERSFAPFIHDGFCMDLVRGRGINRRPYGDHQRGREIAGSILLLGEAAGPGVRARWQGMVKGWARRNTHQPMLEAAERDDLAFHARLAAVLDDDAIPAAEEPVGHRLLPMSARAVHRRPGWCAGLSMASDRVGHYEHGNGENLRGWHTGSGMLYWWAAGHGDQYSDSFWPTVDPYRLPGTTVSTRRLPDGAGAGWGDTCPPGRWVGGATDGLYATVGQHLNGLESTMEAFKSWFFLDDAIVCLGAGIAGKDGVPVETIVDNRRTETSLTRGENWAYLEGHGGYVVPGGVRTLQEKRTHGLVSRSYATLWLDHGVDPTSAGYFYTLLPGASAEETQARAADPAWVDVLANTARQQAVRIPSLGITAANFWNEGTAGPLTASAPCAVLARENPDGTATVSVSDPRRDLTELTVTWHRPTTKILQSHPLVTRAAPGQQLTLTFGDLSPQHGTSITVTISA
ncbi:polysaccharide lyase 8 family protein [Acrocarpospora sp. B8E8]|uniref:polysaccharide lyase 8 family protein n=1 Tax=Acrocarpospora sp. B8E8 TaxID=3153572 RepID=UPI00325FAD3D